jgi:hypothetical protein
MSAEKRKRKKYEVVVNFYKFVPFAPWRPLAHLETELWIK